MSGNRTLTQKFAAGAAVAAMALGAFTATSLTPASAEAATCITSQRVKIKLGYHGIDSVKEAQCRLNAAIGAGLNVDGVFGASTDKAVRAFQQQKGLGVDGVVGPSTWSALVAASGGGSSTPSNGYNAQAAINYARAQKGKPYVWGASGPNSFDCSGLTMKAFAAGGVSLPHKSTEQPKKLHAVSSPQPGDLVYWPGHTHVGIYTGNGKQIDAGDKAGGVIERTVYIYNNPHYYRP